MPAFLQAFSRRAFQAYVCALRVRCVSIRLMQSDGAILTTFATKETFPKNNKNNVHTKA
jgi:hypothetical protein